ncbi:MAG: hypothetical protein AAGI03_05120 [Pseudomonadota bacterium]
MMIICVMLEVVLVIVFYAVYAETIGFLSDVYLSELPGIGSVFELIDRDMTVTHLLAFVLAFFSVAVPVFLWAQIYALGIHNDPGAWLSEPANKVWAVLGGGIYLLVFALEAVNLYTLIAREANNPLPQVDSNPLMDALASNEPLAIGISILIAIINTVIAFMSVKATLALTNGDHP